MKQLLNRFASLFFGSDWAGSAVDNDSTTVQLFNEALLGSSLTDPLPVLMDIAAISWAPSQVVLDYKDNTCYGAMVHYRPEASFETLRAAINSRFSKDEISDFAGNPTMGIWRVIDKGFSIQLSFDDENDLITAIYVRFIDENTMAEKIEELCESQPELFNDLLQVASSDDCRDAGRSGDDDNPAAN